MAGLWWVWRAHNAEFILDEAWPEPKVLRNITSLVIDIQQAYHSSSTNTSSTHMVCCEKPPLGFCKLNVDGCSLGNPGRAGFGGLIRNEIGEWLVGISGFIGHTPISMLNS